MINVVQKLIILDIFSVHDGAKNSIASSPVIRRDKNIANLLHMSQLNLTPNLAAIGWKTYSNRRKSIHKTALQHYHFISLLYNTLKISDNKSCCQGLWDKNRHLLNLIEMGM